VDFVVAAARGAARAPDARFPPSREDGRPAPARAFGEPLVLSQDGGVRRPGELTATVYQNVCANERAQ
jgi:hypothetical protein